MKKCKTIIASLLVLISMSGYSQKKNKKTNKLKLNPIELKIINKNNKTSIIKNNSIEIEKGKEITYDLAKKIKEEKEDKEDKKKEARKEKGDKKPVTEGKIADEGTKKIKEES